MHQRYFWKQLPVPVQWLRPWLLASVALHTVVFSAPLLPDAAPVLPEPEEMVNLAPLPLRSPPPASPAAVPSPAVIASANPQPREFPTQRPIPKAALPPSPAVVVRPVPPRAVVPPAPITSPTPTPTPQAIAPSTPAATVSPSPTLSPSPTPVVSSPSPEIPTPYADFPHVESTTAGCGGRENCWRSGDTRWRAIADTLEQELQEQGYSVSLVDLGTDAGVLVYRVAKAGEPDYYLNLTSTFEQGTVYLISEQPMTAVEIRQEAERKDEG